MNFNFPIILASNSPRRQELLTALDLKFEVMVSSFQETFPSDINPVDVPEFLAKGKAEAVASKEKNALIIAADTVVILENSLLGKPVNLLEAKSMLNQLSGKTHRVVTGVCIKYREYISLFREDTEVTFDHLTQDQINFYVNTYLPMDKAGAYGIQEWIGMVGVTGIRGSYFNVVGLPVKKLYDELVKFREHLIEKK